ncbi:MAG TPA: antibiotic biosynthesis monooxygenase [Candidatus Acidoferrum sp.]|nr:antibiotic biosynthesis monooxygenase [Candidatus Acidoferrum sp.]
MALVSVTRLRVRSFVYLLQFMWEAVSSGRQAEQSPGFLGGRLLRNPGNVFWTITAWEDAAAMNAYRTGGAHRRVMPKLLIWCDEAAVVHWNQESPEPPSWQEAHQHMLKEGKPSKVNHPSAPQLANHIPPPKASRIERTLKPSVLR